MAGWIAVVSTAYCLSGTMADGTGVRSGSVANNFLALGTPIVVTASPTGSREWRVRDRIGWGTQLDFWVPSCAQALAWGRRTVRLKVGRIRHVWKGSTHARARTRFRDLAGPDLADHHRDPDLGKRQLRLISAPPPPFWPWPSWRSSP
jgi:3D (Asp-Asp-Asp) domain-containing protein